MLGGTGSSHMSSTCWAKAGIQSRSRPVADDLVGDVDVAAANVVGLGSLHASRFWPWRRSCVQVRRGSAVEATHRVHVRSTAGDAYGDDFYCFFRSSPKPIQAIPFLEGYDDLDDDELAIACASHQAEPAQLEAVRKVLARAGARSTISRTACRRAGPTGSSATTAPASTPACSRPAARTAGRCIRTATRRIRCSSGSPRLIGARRRRRRRLRRADVRDGALSACRELLTQTPQRIRAAMRGAAGAASAAHRRRRHRADARCATAGSRRAAPKGSSARRRRRPRRAR